MRSRCLAVMGVCLAAAGCDEDATASDAEDVEEAIESDAADVPDGDAADAADEAAADGLDEAGEAAPDADDAADVVDDGGTGWTIETMGAALPSGLGGITAVAAGSVAYIFGGADGPPPASVVDTILRYDPVDDSVVQLPVRLPQPIFLTAAAWDGSAAYLFGGFAGGALTDAIVRFDPAGPEVTTMSGRLPAAVARTAAAGDGAALYVLGGSTGGFAPTGFVATISRYDPAADTVTPSAAVLPSARASRIGAIRCGDRILFFGGWGAAGKFDAILEYVPDTDSLAVLDAHMPQALDGGALACDGTRVYLFGGETATAIVDDIVVFDTADDALATAPVTLPAPLKGHAAVWLDGSAYVFGGQGETGLTAAILRVTPP